MVVLDQVAFENKARRVKSVKIQTFCRCNEGTIDDGAVQGSLQLARKVALDKIAYENEARGLKIF